jgi:mycothiol synthase
MDLRRNTMTREITIRTYRPGDLPALVVLINEADAVDKQERATTLQEMEHEMTFPTASPQTDCFLAWAGDRLVGYTDMYVRKGDPEVDAESIIYCWGVVHPQWRRRGLGGRLLEAACNRASEYLPQIAVERVTLQCAARQEEEHRQTLYRSMGMQPVRYFTNLARSINSHLPLLEVPAGYRFRTFDPQHDAEAVWRVDNTAFRDHWGHTEGQLEEFLHWLEMPHFRPDLWYLAVEESTGAIVGLSLNVIDPDWIAQTGRQEGYVDTLAVLREHRKRGLGKALLVQSLYALRQAGMDGVHLHADAENLTGAMRLYERVGFRVRKTSIAYQRVLRYAGRDLASILTGVPESQPEPQTVPA